MKIASSLRHGALGFLAASFFAVGFNEYGADKAEHMDGSAPTAGYEHRLFAEASERIVESERSVEAEATMPEKSE